MSGFASTRDQVDSLILYIGDKVKESGKPISELSGFHGSIGAPDQQSADRVLEKLAEEGLVEKQEFARVIRRSRRRVAVTHETTAEEGKFFEVDLTREGWSLYEKLKRVLPEGNYGFIAREFEVPDFTSFVNKVVKPEVKRKTGYELVDMNDVRRAGIIDERMRECHYCLDVFVQAFRNCLITHVKSAIKGCHRLELQKQFQMIFIPIKTTGGKYHVYRETGLLTVDELSSMAHIPKMRTTL